MYRHIPNLITIFRLILTIAFFFILNNNDDQNFERQMAVGFGVFIAAVLTDILDGYLARRWHVESAFGRVVDPFVDKILICGAFIFFSSNHFIDVAARNKFLEFRPGIPASLTGVVPWMVVVLIAREFLITSIRGLAEAQGVDFRSDWAGKIKMFTQSVAVGAILMDLSQTNRIAWIHWVRDAAIWTTIVVTVLSASTYLWRARSIFAPPARRAQGVNSRVGHGVKQFQVDRAAALPKPANRWPRWIISGGGPGFLRPAPGSWGTALPAGLLWLALSLGFSDPARSFAFLGFGLIASGLLIAYGKWAAAYYRDADPPTCVLDEYAGFAVTAAFVPIPSWCMTQGVWGYFAFTAGLYILFRFTDTMKFPPANWLERLPWGWGVLCDDLAAGLQANLVAQLIVRLWLS